METTVANPLALLQTNIEKARNGVLAANVYAHINSIERLKTFTEYHVWAVWDFMSLVKSLQQKLTCTNTPWLPIGSGSLRRFINEIVLGEESDINPNGGYCSHFELYLNAMKQMGANTTAIEKFVSLLEQGLSVTHALKEANAPLEAQNFVNQTFSEINGQQTHRIAASFAIGREELIPDMFAKLIADLNKQHASLVSEYAYYLQRHIDIDGDEHGPMAQALLLSVCGHNQSLWHEAAEAANQALEARRILWEAIVKSC